VLGFTVLLAPSREVHTYVQSNSFSGVRFLTDGTIIRSVATLQVPNLINTGVALLAVAEARNWTGDGCMPPGWPSMPDGPRDLVMKVSIDGGRSWGVQRMLYRGGLNSAAVYDAVRGRAIIHCWSMQGTVCGFDHGFCCVRVSSIGLWLLYGTRCRQKSAVHSRMPVSVTPLLRVKRCHACDQWHASRVFALLTGWHCGLRPNTDGGSQLDCDLQH
jgi:hypothetical protein